MNVCLMKHFIANVKDQETKQVLQYAKNLSEGHIVTLTTIFNKEKLPLPVGFTNADVNIDAPKLFSDMFYLRYLQKMGRVGTSINGMALGTSYREDVVDFYLSAVNESGQLFKKVINVLKEKGTLIRSPYIHYPETVEYVPDEQFFSGYLTLHKRPLLAVEINHLANNIEANAIGQTMIEGFAQVVTTKEVREYLQKGMMLSRKIIDTLDCIIKDNHTTSPFTACGTVTTSTTAPFSDKLVMAVVSMLNMVSLSNLSQGSAASMRSDLVGEYLELTARVSKFSTSGAKISVKNGWLEKPPQTPDRKRLQEHDK
jgi:hypothetical protein